MRLRGPVPRGAAATGADSGDGTLRLRDAWQRAGLRCAHRGTSGGRLCLGQDHAEGREPQSDGPDRPRADQGIRQDNQRIRRDELLGHRPAGLAGCRGSETLSHRPGQPPQALRAGCEGNLRLPA